MRTMLANLFWNAGVFLTITSAKLIPHFERRVSARRGFSVHTETSKSTYDLEVTLLPNHSRTQCPACAKHDVTTKFRPIEVELEIKATRYHPAMSSIPTDELYSVCGDCGFEFYTPEQLNANTHALNFNLSELEK